MKIGGHGTSSILVTPVYVISFVVFRYPLSFPLLPLWRRAKGKMGRIEGLDASYGHRIELPSDVGQVGSLHV